jgi:hypothetical protein
LKAANNKALLSAVRCNYSDAALPKTILTREVPSGRNYDGAAGTRITLIGELVSEAF